MAPASQLSAAYRSCRIALTSVILFSCAINLLMLTGPLFMLQVYDRVLPGKSVPTLVVLTILVGAMFVFLGLFELVRSRMLARVGRHMDEQIHAPLFAAVVDHAIRRTSNVHIQPLRDLDIVRQFLSGPSPGTLFDVPWTPLYLAVIFLLHVDLGYFALAGAILLAALALINDRLTCEPLHRANESSSASHRVAEESYRNAAVIRAMGMLPAMSARWQVIRGRLLEDHVRASDRNGALSAIAKVLRLFLQSAILALGAFLAIKQEITAGAIIAASIIMSRALAPIEQGIFHWRSLLQFRNACGRLNLVFADIGQQIPNMVLPSPKGRLTVENVSMAAPGERPLILRDITFSLNPGQAMGIVGPTGVGKSTLARGLVNIWAPTSGVVTLDSAPLDQWDPVVLGQSIGYLPQDVELFDGTFDENIGRFEVLRKPENVIRAAKLAGIHDLILRFPRGYKTPIGEDGAKLSAGQRQRVGLARALYGQPAILIMDEPNANLDAIGEAALSHAIRSEKKRGAAIVVITHRPSAMAAVDLLLYLDDGRQIAFGPKDTVLRKFVGFRRNGNAPVISTTGGELSNG